LASALRFVGGSFLRSAWRAGRRLFHEVTSSFFAVFALGWAATAWREWHHDTARWLLALTIGFAVLMAAFAVTSFLQARRVR
jgi:hypothetical protein